MPALALPPHPSPLPFEFGVKFYQLHLFKRPIPVPISDLPITLPSLIPNHPPPRLGVKPSPAAYYYHYELLGK